MKLKAPDADAIPLCRLHHIELGAQNGHFKGWTREEIRAWEREQMEKIRSLLPSRPKPDRNEGPE